MNCRALKLGSVLAGLLSIMIFFTACQREWYFTVTSIADPSHPQFCVSLSKECNKPGVDLALLDINEVTNSGESIGPVWAIQAVENRNLSKVIYGTPPEGYKELMAAKPLEIGKWYSVHSKFYFRMIQNGIKLRAEVYSLEEFYRSSGVRS